jgi:signal transduction histidine kinase/CheY-like chemotaxis protein
VFAAPQADAFLATIRRALAEHRVVELEYTLPIGGRDVCFAASIAPITEDRVVWVARDVTERRAAERALHEVEEGLRQAARLETIGRLAGSIAHDFNNLLTGVAGYTELALEDVDPGHPVAADLREIRAATRRAADLARQLLAFSRGQQLRPEWLDLNHTLAGLTSMLRCLTGERIDLRITSAGALPPVFADRSQIERVIVNLVVNARDAMPDGGVLEIRTASREVSPAPGAAGRYVTLEVCDSGCGIPVEALPRLFDPFFSTKAPDRGTGLGLWFVSTMVRQAGGHVLVQSTPGRGSTFTVCLPEQRDVGEAVPGGGPRPDAAASGRVGGPETILLVEDDVNLRTVVERMLERFGFTVLSAGNGVEALTVLDGRPHAVDLLLTDVVMPELGGPELVEHLAHRGVRLRVLYMSGYSDQAVLRRIALSPTCQLLRKPFTLDELLTAVRRMLDG